MRELGKSVRLTANVAVVLACAALLGCTTPIASALEEPEANRVMLALDRAHVAATKEVDPTAEGRFRVRVADGDASRALAALRAEELPRRRSAGLEGAGKGSLVPSPQAEQAQIALGLAGELERSLEGVDGVLSARVHLSLPVTEPFRDAPRERAAASVLVAHRGTTPPLAEDAVQRLVAGAAPGLAPADVAVVYVARGPAAVTPDDGMAQLGPFGVARGSLRPIQITFGVMLALMAALAAALAFTGSRLSRQKSALEAARAKPR